MGPTMDHQIIRSLFGWVIEASTILDVDVELRQKLTEMRSRIAPNQVGRFGQLQEWLEDIDSPKNRHRHLSHLWGVHPGSEIHPRLTPKLADAACVSLTHRGMGNVGWSLAWQVGLWARLGDGERAYRALHKLLPDALPRRRSIQHADLSGNGHGALHFDEDTLSTARAAEVDLDRRIGDERCPNFRCLRRCEAQDRR